LRRYLTFEKLVVTRDPCRARSAASELESAIIHTRIDF